LLQFFIGPAAKGRGIEMSDKEIKVTDKRMFTSEGELREEYRFLEDKATAAPAATEPPPPPPPPEPEPPRGARSRAPAPPEPPAPPQRGGSERGRPAPPPEPEGWPAAGGPALELPGTPPGLAPTFYDLAAVLAEPVAVYLGDVDYEGQSAENLEMARLHIDLLDVLRQKTAGNLTAQETAFLEDLLYRLRVRYVQKRG
jgi:hypothetical protein